MEAILGPDGDIRLGDFLIENLSSGFKTFRGASAWARKSGIKHLEPHIKEFAKVGDFNLTIGVDLLGTSVEALEMLLYAVPQQNSLFIFHNPASPTFHPKAFQFLSEQSYKTYIGSGNLTAGGLYTNYEAGIVIDEHVKSGEMSGFQKQMNEQFGIWTDTSKSTVVELNHALVEVLKNEGLIATEAVAIANQYKKSKKSNSATTQKTFVREATKPAPQIKVEDPKPKKIKFRGEVAAPTDSLPVASRAKAKLSNEKAGDETAESFVMTLQKTDVGVGQTSAGRQKRSPEIFIPLIARDLHPSFWGWPSQFTADLSRSAKTDKNGFGKMDRFNVPFLLKNEPIEATFFFNPNKGDLRIRNGALRDAGEIGDLIVITKLQTAEGDVYSAEIVEQNSPEYNAVYKKCDKSVKKPSLKKFGYF